MVAKSGCTQGGGVFMGAITLRGLEPSLTEKLKRAAKKQGKSINQMVKDTLKQHLGMSKDKKFTLVHHDLDHLFGRWSEEEFKRIQKKIDFERKTDEELWR
jgi:plasmid stability protein